MADHAPPEQQPQARPAPGGPEPRPPPLGPRVDALGRQIEQLAAVVQHLVERQAAPSGAAVEPGVRPAPELAPEGEEVARPEGRGIELAGDMGHVLDGMSEDVSQQFSQGLFGRREQREVRGLRKLLMRIPFAGALFSGTFKIADLDRHLAVVPVAATLANVGGKINTAKDVLLATRGAVEAIAAPTAVAALAGAGLRVATDTLRWVGGEKTVRTLAREIAWRATGKGRSLDTRAAWYTLFGRRIKDLEELARRGPQLSPEEGERFIREAFYAETNLRALDNLLPPDQQQKFAQTQLQDIQIVRQAYEQARTLYNRLPAEIQDRIIDGFPDWVRRREFFNHLETMGLRGVIAGFKTGLFGGAFSLARGLFTTGIMGELGRRVSAHVGSAAKDIGKFGQDAWNGLVSSADKHLEALKLRAAATG